MYKIRFNLGRGLRYKKWKIIKPNNEVEYYDPQSVYFLLENATLKNNPKVSLNIFNGANKRVCAWIECENIRIFTSKSLHKIDSKLELKYNPRNLPYWEQESTNVDNMSYNNLITLGNKIFINENCYYRT